jgi:glycosyltransferase involved in cell wall biosynthesis
MNKESSAAHCGKPRIRFITATPFDVTRGSGTFVGISTLLQGVRALGYELELIKPERHFWPYTASRLWFNQRLRRLPGDADITVGFDLDGYTLAQGPGVHVAAIKGVIADEARFESGFAAATMKLQASREKLHAQRAKIVLTTSQYSAGQIAKFYGVRENVRIVPEGIEMESWQRLLAQNAASPDPTRFTLLSVCHFYRRKRLNVLLRAAARLRSDIPNLQLRIVGGGPERQCWHALAHELGLANVVSWLGHVEAAGLALEYRACDAFCLPSVQEGFGIVFLEAMAAGKPVIAANAAAAPEVVKHGLLAAPDDDEGLAALIRRLHREPQLRYSLADRGREDVRQYDAPLVTRRFLEAIGAGEEKLSPGGGYNHL